MRHNGDVSMRYDVHVPTDSTLESTEILSGIL